MTDHFIFEDLPRFEPHAVWTSNLISRAFGEIEAAQFAERLGQWLHIENTQNEIQIAYLGLKSSPKDPNFTAVFSLAEKNSFGGVSLSRSFSNYLVNLATKSEDEIPNDFDRGFLGVLFADLADSLVADFFPGVQFFLDSTTLEKASRQTERYLFAFELSVGSRKDQVGIYLPKDWPLPSLQQTNKPAPNIALTFPLIVGHVPMKAETIADCQAGDLLIPDHAIEKDDIQATIPYAQLALNKNKFMNARLSFDEEQWIFTFLNQELSMDDSITTLIADHAELNVRIVAGSVEIPLSELASLAPGYTLEVDRALHEGVDLEVNGRVFAKGELVNIGGKLGVRIVKRVS